MSEYGPLAGLVGSTTALITAGGAITLAWVRGANWAPPEDDVPSGPSRVVSLLTAIAVAGLWFETGKSLYSHDLEKLAINFGAITFFSLLAYSFLMGVYIYTKDIATSTGTVEKIRVVGGFWLTPEAKQNLREARTVQRLFAGAAFDPDLVWPRESRSLVKNCFIVSFSALLLSGSIAISSIALSIDPSASVAPASNLSSGK